ncbi:signal peptidase I [Candidatus Woesearchaeota archaeon]|nr:signal peptidase I [Candidatus Woesearchaeota archaeon]
MSTFRKIWNFIWHEDSILSWIVNIILALVIVKFLIYPGLGLIFNTNYPLVAVVSGSMEHNQRNFDEWWSVNGNWYEKNNITKEQFEKFRFKNGFNKGDIMVLFGSKNVKVGDVIVYTSTNTYPIIHRVVKINQDSSFIMKGDHNSDKDPTSVSSSVGKAVIRIPLLGYIKILFIDYIFNPILKPVISFIIGIFK